MCDPVARTRGKPDAEEKKGCTCYMRVTNQRKGFSNMPVGSPDLAVLKPRLGDFLTDAWQLKKKLWASIRNDWGRYPGSLMQ